MNRPDLPVLDVSYENLLQKTHGTDIFHSVFHTLAYADVFDYPLTAPEVYRYLISSNGTIEEVTRLLAEDTRFSKVGNYFTLRGREEIVEVRKRRAQVASQLWPKAVRYGRTIASLPFVKMVAITGSLAMNNTEKGKDIDYMIVTAPNRLWTCRALSLLVARIAKLEGISLCPNYLITTKALELRERSLYVAHELAQMIPIFGMNIYRELRNRNDWANSYLPNARKAPEPSQAMRKLEGSSLIQRLVEMVFNLPFGDWLEQWEMKRKIERLTREQSHSVESYFSADVCKGHIDKHGEHVVTALAVRLKQTTAPDLTDGGRKVVPTETR